MEVSTSPALGAMVGQLGPEENIIEAVYEFCKKYPKIKTIIPRSLSLYAQPLFSHVIQDSYEKLIDRYKSVLKDGFNACENKIIDTYCQVILHGKILDSKNYLNPILIKKYILGSDYDSGFMYQLKGLSKCLNAVHFYFQAELCDGVILKTDFMSPLTHWMHAYVFRTPRSCSLNISYNSKLRKFVFEWI